MPDTVYPGADGIERLRGGGQLASVAHLDCGASRG
jgi:hypothetical protein